MTNEVQPGDILELTAPYARSAGQGALIGTLFGVAITDLASGESGSFKMKGVFTLPKAAVTITVGEAAYWDDTAKAVTDVSTSTTLIGAFTSAAASGVATVNVRIR